MTATRQWLERHRRELQRLEVSAGTLLALCLTLVALGAGVVLARRGAYLSAPWALLLAWLAPAAAVAAGVGWYRRRMARLEAQRLAAALEGEAGLRQGSLAGVAGEEALRGSQALAAVADQRAAAWLAEHGDRALAPLRARETRAVRLAAVAALTGAAIFAITGPMSGEAAAFWSPFGALARARGPIAVTADRAEVRRGERVTVTVYAGGRASATLWVRAPGEAWQAHQLTLDSAGRASRQLGPLEADRFIRATAGSRTSGTIRVRVALPSLLAELGIVAQYPDYLRLADEPLAPGADTVAVPVGTRIVTHGRSTVPLRSVSWFHEGRTTELATTGREFAGPAVVMGSGTWRLLVFPAGGGVLDAPPELHLLAVEDSLPTLTVLVPAGDTVVPATLKQPLVVDVRDDDRVMRVELLTRRVGRAGAGGGRQAESIPVPEGAAGRLVLQWVLDLNGRGYVPGDTAYFRVRAYDNAPSPQMAETREYALRLPTLADMRQAVRETARQLAAGADSLVRTQTGLARETEDAAAEREREAAEARKGEDAKEMPFRSVQRSEEVARRQQEVLDRAEQVRERLRELAEAARAAGLNDPQFQQQLRDLQRMIDQAVTPELREQLDRLRESLRKLDARQARDVMQQLSESARQLTERLEQSKEMLQRAAIEGSMTTLASDAEDLAQRQKEWNERAGRKLDSSMASQEQRMAGEADSLAARLEMLKTLVERGRDHGTAMSDSVRVADSLRAERQRQLKDPAGRGRPPEAGEQKGPGREMSQRAKAAASDMRQAAQEARERNIERARGEGEEASENLDPLAQQLRKSRDDLRVAWKAEVMRKMDHALAETSELAGRQDALARRMRLGEAGADVRGEQATLREGVDRIIQRLRQAAGKNALVSPELSTALGYARMRMKEALEQLSQAAPNTKSAAAFAGQAVTGLTSVAYALLTAREDVRSAGSGSGFAEAVERFARMAGTQSALAGQSGQLLPIVMQGQTPSTQQEVKKVGAGQRGLAEELERLRAEGHGPAGTGELAEEAKQLARQLETGQLDRRTVERQERLFRRLLDAGRTLRGDEEDQNKERRSETAKDGNVLVPPALTGAAGAAPRFPYPSWDDLRRLSPEERRLILDYFRRLNDAR